MYRQLASTLAFILFVFIHLPLSAQEPPEPGSGIILPYAKGEMPNILTPSLNVLIYDNGTGESFGFVYEHFLGKSGILSLSLPVYYFGAGHSYSTGGIFGPSVERESHINGFYFAPGVMFHTGSNTHLDFAIGPQLMLGKMTRRESGYTDFQEKGTMTGMLVDMNLTLQSSGGFVFVPHFNFGWTMSGPYEGFIMQTGIRFGGRF